MAIKKSCPFCFAVTCNVKITATGQEAPHQLVEYRCEDCGTIWTEVEPLGRHPPVASGRPDKPDG